MQRIDLSTPDVDMDEQQILLYRGEPFTGEAVEYYENGEMWSLATYRDGIKDGPNKQWYRDGSPKLDGVVSEGLAVGEWREWRPDGQLVRVDEFDADGELVSRRTWNDAGELTEEHQERGR